MLLLGTMEICLPRVLRRKMASYLQMLWHNQALCCGAKFCQSNFDLFLIFPSPVLCTLRCTTSRRKAPTQHNTASGGGWSSHAIPAPIRQCVTNLRNFFRFSM